MPRRYYTRRSSERSSNAQIALAASHRDGGDAMGFKGPNHERLAREQMTAVALHEGIIDTYGVAKQPTLT